MFKDNVFGLRILHIQLSKHRYEVRLPNLNSPIQNQIPCVAILLSSLSLLSRSVSPLVCDRF